MGPSPREFTHWIRIFLELFLVCLVLSFSASAQSTDVETFKSTEDLNVALTELTAGQTERGRHLLYQNKDLITSEMIRKLYVQADNAKDKGNPLASLQLNSFAKEAARLTGDERLLRDSAAKL